MRLYFSLFVLILSASMISSSVADDRIAEMRGVYSNFKKLMEFAVNEESFLDKKNESEIATLLVDLKSRFHSLDVSKKEMNDPGFKVGMEMVEADLKDTIKRFGQGKKEYALQKVRRLAGDCMACHTRHEIKRSFLDGIALPDSMSAKERARFYLATRQLYKAKDEIGKAIKEESGGIESYRVLRYWLLLTVRTGVSPEKAIQELDEMVAAGLVDDFELDEVRSWRDSFVAWSKEKKSEAAVLQQARVLLLGVLKDPALAFGDKFAVDILRATDLLHTYLEDDDLDEEKRAEALYLLGVSYDELSLFFPGERAQRFLEMCIRQYPDTPYAKRAFKLYRHIVVSGYTGSGGTHLPDDVAAKLDELKGLIN